MAKPKQTSAPRFRRVPPEERKALLIEAGLACLARGGAAGFTTGTICAEAQVSRGLITHHFGSIDGLLAAIYETMIARLIAVTAQPGSGAERVAAIIAASFEGGPANRDTLRIWLALWGEIATNPQLLRAHRRQYARYRAGLEAALAQLAAERRRNVDIELAAMMLASLIDGLWLEWSIDPRQISAQAAKAACGRLLESFFGPYQD